MFEGDAQSFEESWKTERFRFAFRTFGGLSISKGDLGAEGTPCVNYGEVHSVLGIFSDPNVAPLKRLSETHPMHAKGSRLRDGDLVFADTSEDIAGSGNFTRYCGASPAFPGYHTVCARPRIDMRNRYIAYLFDSTSVRKQIRQSVNGVKVYSITQSVLADIELTYPSLAAQERITNFLDDKTEKIDRAIAIKEAQIARLEERKQILIQTAVTRGLNPDAPMKDSGVDWIGQIPAHWEVKRIKHLLKERNERSISGEEPLLMVSQVHGLVVRSEFHEKASAAADSIDSKKVYYGDLVFNKLKAHLGVFFRSNISDIGLVSPDYAVYEKTPLMNDLKFLELLFRHPDYIKQFIIRATGIVEGLIRLYTEDLFDLKVAVPPLDEQKQILQNILVVSSKIDSALSLQKSQITHLREYRASLINAAVTGKIKVPA